MDLEAYRTSEREQLRISNLFELIPEQGNRVLDVGAREGYVSKLLAARFLHVTALDLQAPPLVHARVEPVKGDVTALDFEDNTFDAVFCAEVLEHIPGYLLERACSEIRRVAKHSVIIGVPYMQDLRCARTTCRTCGKLNPPWGHVNAFDETRLRRLFDGMAPTQCSYVGMQRERTNRISAALMNFAGNPYGTYEQEEACVHCGAGLQPPAARSIWQKVATKVAFTLTRIQRKCIPERPVWLHMRFDKPASTRSTAP